jgi:hypothetical protein
LVKRFIDQLAAQPAAGAAISASAGRNTLNTKHNKHNAASFNSQQKRSPNHWTNQPIDPRTHQGTLVDFWKNGDI